MSEYNTDELRYEAARTAISFWAALTVEAYELAARALLDALDADDAEAIVAAKMALANAVIRHEREARRAEKLQAEARPSYAKKI